MKLKHIAFASLLACASTAWGQSGVTLYGVTDVNLEFANNVGAVPQAANKYSPGPANHVVRMDSGGLAGSRWGLRGVEDLGGGLSALFVLESGFGLNNGSLQQSGRLFGRQAFVGLKSAQFGQITFGRQYASMFEGLANFSPTAYATQYEPAVLQVGPNYRLDNTAKYTGTFGPVTAVAHWSFGAGLALPPASPAAPQTVVGGNGEVPGQLHRDSAYGTGLTYDSGSFAATVGYDQYNPTIGTGTGSFRKAAIAASYTLDKVKVMGGYRWGKNIDQTGATLLRDDMYWVGASYQVAWQVALVADYALSKRTDVYLTTAYAKNAGLTLDSAATAYATSLSLGNSYALGAGQTSMMGIALGIRHKF
jgi:predicted porin